MILFAMTWLISRSTVPILSELAQVVRWCVKWIPCTHPPDLSCDYIVRNVTEIRNYGGSCTFLCLSEMQSVLFTAIRVTCWTSRLLSLRKKLKIATRTKIDFRILIWNRYNNPHRQEKNSQQGEIGDQITMVPREPGIVRYLSNPGLHITEKIQ